MTNDQAPAVSLPAGGRGRLAEVIATRGGKAAPEEPFVIEHREALIYMLCEAAELEHGIMCQYLFAAFSLKQSADEGLAEAELAAVRRWRKTVLHVATQEMLHLALVHNLLSAIGAAPHLARPNLPAPAGHYPAGVQLALIPFGEQALRHFMFLERPEGMDLADAAGLAAMGEAVPLMNVRDIVPRGQDFATVGHLYRSIEAGFSHLAELYGEDWLFVGPPRAQATETNFRWPELVRVTDLASACRAIEEILEQGEGPRGHWRDAHFGQFVNILDSYLQLRAANPAFEPVRPVIAANVRPHDRGGVPLITDLLTARVTDLFNVCYEILLQAFERFFAHTEETDAQLQALADATIALMARVISPLGGLITTLPVGGSHPGRTAGPSFELFYESDYLMPHREAAWALLSERLNEAAWLCGELCTGRGRHVADQLEPMLTALTEIAGTLVAHLPEGSPHARLASRPPRLEPATRDALLSQANDLLNAAATTPATTPPASQILELFQSAHAVALATAQPAADPVTQALALPRLVNSVLRPLAGALARLAPGAGGAAGRAPRPAGTKAPHPASEPGVDHASGSAGTAVSQQATEPGADQAPGPAEAQLWDTTKAATQLRMRLAGEAGGAPPELAEASAALQDVALQLVTGREREVRLAELWALQAGLPPTIQPARGGPHLVTNVPRLVDYLGAESRPAPQLALCRCGQSAIRPRCDGTCAAVGFTDAKDPKRVPDRRDTYPGQQVTVFDNRGICQHSGFCTDRLATVFRSGQEPFVAPSGGRMDEIIRAVRDCPSGALSYAFGGIEARGHVDWDHSRQPSIEITKDGPYRITGGIALTAPDGGPVARNRGSSLEHYALCRCGQSQNKPFCSGMHWYVQFRDPVAAPGHEPTPYEWAGGLPALTRAARLLYEKHVPADPSLAAQFGQMPPGQPERLARWLSEALGGPASKTGGDAETDLRQVVGFTAADVGEQHRARWAALAAVAADEAVLPAEPEFRSVLSSCLEWASRTALAMAQPGAAPRPVTMPRWDWGPGGPPSAAPAAGQADEAEVALPGPDEPVGFAVHIKPLFRDRDRQSMSFAFDLWSYDDVRSRAQDILGRLQEGSMPCDGAWPAAKIEVFERWTDTGMQP